MLFSTLLSLAALAPFANAHFSIESPPQRDADEENQDQFPCGGASTPSTERTPWSLTGGPIQLNMGHERVALQVLLGLGNDPGDAFNTIILPTINQEGLGDFCVGQVVSLMMVPRKKGGWSDGKQHEVLT